MFTSALQLKRDPLGRACSATDPSTRMTPQAQVVWAGLEFRKPATLQLLEPLTSEELRWRPPSGANPIGWQVWHIAEVEDNWVRQLLLGEARSYPLGRSVREAAPDQYPPKSALLSYFHEVRERSRARLEATTEEAFDHHVRDAHFGELTVREVWGGVVTSFAWHAGQIALTVRLLRGGNPFQRGAA